MSETKLAEDPPFTIADVRAVIPKELFKKDLKQSFYWVAHDCVLVAILLLVGVFVVPALPGWAQLVAWPLWWIAQGTVMTGLWVIAHECGHQAFADEKWINNTVGWIFHSLLLVPYHSWRISHSKHHKGTNSLEKDQVFVPKTREDIVKRGGPYSEIPVFVVLNCLKIVLLGWPAYLIANLSSSKYPGHKWVNHFDPYSPIFNEKQRLDIVVSDIGLALVGYLLYRLGSMVGGMNLVFYYLLPYLVVNFWLVTITYLQHNHAEIPHYKGDAWSFLKGALATVDRSYGIFDHFHHHIADSHVVHHLFSTMPHYNAVKAMPYVKKFLLSHSKQGKFYHEDHTHFLVALYNARKNLQWVEPVSKEQPNLLHFTNKFKAN